MKALNKIRLGLLVVGAWSSVVGAAPGDEDLIQFAVDDGVQLRASATATSTATALAQEASNSAKAVGPINAATAYKLGYTGKGVRVAILDTGLNLKNTEFAGSGRVLAGYNALNKNNDITDNVNHGTHVAGLIGASLNSSGMYGVAYQSTLIPVKVMDTSGGTTSALARGLDYAVQQRASVVNMSLGTTVSFGVTSFQAAVKADTLIVAAAGNAKLANPDWPARFAKETWANGQIIAVGAVDANNVMASFSNKAGDTAAWYVVAPGVGLYSSYGTGYATMSGTSMATPVVSGAAALIKQRWPYKNAHDVAEILFVTATDLGAPGIDSVYGRGLINVDKAMQPIGTLTTSSWNGSTVKILSTTIKPSAATAAIYKSSVDGDLVVTATDNYQRDYQVNLGSAVGAVQPLSLSSVFGAIDARIQFSENVLRDGSRMAWVADNRPLMVTEYGQQAAGAREQRLMGFSWSSAPKSGVSLGIGSGGFSQNAFGLAAVQAPGMPQMALVKSLQNPYLNLINQPHYASMSYGQDGRGVRFGVLSATANGQLAQAQGVWATGQSAGARGAVVELGQRYRDLYLSTSLTTTTETGSYLGSTGQGGLQLGDSARTQAVQFNGAWRLSEKLALAGQYATGYTPGYSGANQLISQMSGLRTESMSLALVGSDRFVAGDHLSLSVSQPMRAVSGSMTLDYVAGVDENGEELRAQRKISMVPERREVLTEASYMMPVGLNKSFGLTVAYRQNPMHRSDVADEKLVAMRYAAQF